MPSVLSSSEQKSNGDAAKGGGRGTIHDVDEKRRSSSLLVGRHVLRGRVVLLVLQGIATRRRRRRSAVVTVATTTKTTLSMSRIAHSSGFVELVRFFIFRCWDDDTISLAPTTDCTMFAITVGLQRHPSSRTACTT